MDFSNIIQSTAGAIPFINEKGDVSMQKVKVQRYITGKRPAYAPHSDQEHSDDDLGALNDSEEFLDDFNIPIDDNTFRNISHSPRKLNRKYRSEPEILFEATDRTFTQEHKTLIYDSDENERYLDEHEIAFKRQMIKQDLTHRATRTDDLLEIEDEISEKEAQFSSEYEDYTDSEEEIGSLRMKPFFVKKEDRVTICTDERKEQESKITELEKRQQIDDRKRESHQLLEEIICLEKQMEQGASTTQDVVLTDDENDEVEYEEWKLRELKRIKRDRDERERFGKEKEDIEKIHLMSERERKIEFEKNPRFILNKQSNEKQYKFLQKYYHRGAFFLNKEENVYKRDFSKPTLEDHFNKQILPKVMQVKSFGRSGRTKYTHLLDQDTTQKDSNPWSFNDPLAIKFLNKGGGMKQTFEKPTSKWKKQNQN